MTIVDRQGEEPMDPGMEKLLTRVSEDWTAAAEKAAPFDEASFLELLKEEDSRALVPGDARVVPVTTRRSGRLLGYLGWVAAAAACLALALLRVGEVPEVGAVQYRQGAGAEAQFARLNPGNVLETAVGEGLVFSLDQGRVTVQVAGGSRVTIVSADEIFLDRGDIWTHVRTRSGEFEVETAHGMVEVHGTTFGVRVDESGTHAVVAEGVIEVGIDGECVEMLPGTRALIPGGGGAPVFEAAPDDVMPEWVHALRQENGTSASGSIITPPSQEQ